MIKSLINKFMGKKNNTKEKSKEENSLVGKKITTKPKKEDLSGEVVKLKPDESHTVLEESVTGFITDKSNGLWISKTKFKL